MGKFEACWGGKIYAFKKQYPVIREFEKRMKIVEKELNKDYSQKKRMCDDCRKPMCKNVCKNRQKP